MRPSADLEEVLRRIDWGFTYSINRAAARFVRLPVEQASAAQTLIEQFVPSDEKDRWAGACEQMKSVWTQGTV